jgi:7 transmembrane helices usually fused to an inactive transglutaminase/Inactive transglutaminase fused to 7 transmembrane helices
MRNLQVYILAAVLAAIGLGLTAYKYAVIGLPLRERASVSAWEVESEIRVTANGGPLKLSTFVPEDSREFSVLDHRVAAPDFGVTVAPEGANRRLNLTARDAGGLLVARQRFVVHRNDVRAPERRQLPPFPQDITLSQTAQAIARTLYASAHGKSSDATSLVSVLLRDLISRDRAENVRFLLGDDRAPRKIAALAAQILRVNGLFARAVHGVDLAKTGISVDTKTWLEVTIGDHWQVFSVATGEPRIPRGYFAWWRGDAGFANVSGGKFDRQRISITRVEQTVLRHALALGKHSGAFLTNYSLYELPATQRAVFRVIMTIPIGVFMLVVLRNLVGLRGVGTFMPVLIALSFRDTHLVWGLLLFSVALAAGLLVRLYFDHLKLLLVARLGAIVMFVILFLAAVTVLSGKLNFEPGLSVALFPLVILTMTIERVSVIWDESGPAEAVKLAVLSLIIAAVCYLLMAARPVQHVFFAFPEMILVLMALTLLIGRYTGYRLSELLRFRVLAEPRP